MGKRGLQMLEAHMRSFDPDAATARERLEAALGEEFARQLLQGLLSSPEKRSSTGSESADAEAPRQGSWLYRGPAG